MRKVLTIVAVIGAALLALGATSLAFAQTQTPPTPAGIGNGGFGPGGRGGGFGQGMMGGSVPGSYGPVHEYMVEALAEALDLAPEELQARRDAGETLWEIAEAQGITQEAFGDLWTEARTAALNQAVADGVITPEQADWMIERMAQRQAAGFGPGSGGCTGTGPTGGRHGGPGWRWSSP